MSPRKGKTSVMSTLPLEHRYLTARENTKGDVHEIARDAPDAKHAGSPGVRVCLFCRGEDIDYQSAVDGLNWVDDEQTKPEGGERADLR